MKISIDTKEDSHEDLKKVIRMLQNIVGDSQEIFTNAPSETAAQPSPMANIFGDISSTTQASPETPQESAQTATEEASQSTEDLFAELFSEDELKKMEPVKEPEDEDEEEELAAKSKDKKYGIEFY